LKRPAAASTVARSTGADAKKQKVVKAPAAKEIKKPVAPAVVRDERVVEVEAGLFENENLNVEARDMLCSMSDLVLLTPKEDRAPQMTAVVDLFQKTLGEVMSKYEGELADKLKEVDEFNVLKEQTESKVAELTEQMNAHKAVFLESRNKMADVARAFRTARESLGQAECKAIQSQDEARNAVALKEDLNTIKTDNLAFLIENPLHEDASAKASLLISVARRANLDESLLNSLPTTLAKATSDRGAFDRMVIAQCEKEMVAKIEQLEVQIASADSKQAELKSEVAAAQAIFDEAKENQIKQAALFTEVQTESTNREVAVEEAQKQLVELSDKVQHLLKRITTVRRSIEAFASGPIAAFEKLRDLEKPAPVVEEAPAPMNDETPGATEAPVLPEADVQVEETAAVSMEVTQEAVLAA